MNTRTNKVVASTAVSSPLEYEPNPDLCITGSVVYHHQHQLSQTCHVRNLASALCRHCAEAVRRASLLLGGAVFGGKGRQNWAGGGEGGEHDTQEGAESVAAFATISQPATDLNFALIQQ